MKKLLFIMAALVLSLNMSYSQESEKQEIKSLFGDGKVDFGFYAGPSVKFSQMNGELAIFVGGKGAVTMNKSFSVGIAGYGNVLWPSVEYNLVKGNWNETVDTLLNEELMFGYGGMYLEYIYNPNEIIHFSANTLFGFGGSTLQDLNSQLENNDYYDYNNQRHMPGRTGPWAAHFIIEPTVAVQMNVTSFFRIALEAGYRYVGNIRTSNSWDDVDAQKELKLSGFSGGLTLEFGSF